MKAITGFLAAMAPYMAVAAFFWPAVRLAFLKLLRKKINLYHEAGLYLFVAFIAGLASQTVMPEVSCGPEGLTWAAVGRIHETRLLPFRFICYTYEDLFVRHSMYSLLINILGNIVMFMPFGFFPPLLWDTSGKKTVALGFCVSLLIELTQLFLPRSTDVDDLILNTAGTALGFIFFRLVHQCFMKTPNKGAADDSAPRK